MDTTTKLTKEIIESFNLPRKPYRPDHNDFGWTFTLPSGIDLEGFYVLNGKPCETGSLDGMNGYINIDTKEELEELISMDYEQTLLKYEIPEDEF